LGWLSMRVFKGNRSPTWSAYDKDPGFPTKFDQLCQHPIQEFVRVE